ncbi:hypothetical protein TgHK011_007441 [Trichoderma gracile]|nr:hypothetical protein TgHK011_007441 [Trichoderma gracile]
MPPSDLSVAEEIYRGLASLLRLLWQWVKGPGMHRAAAAAAVVMRQVRRNMTARRLLSFPHLLAFFWMLLLLWGERWIFTSHVSVCDWKNWEKWPKGATPHHLVLIADPQILDPHTNPDWPSPVLATVVAVTDRYLKQGYHALLHQLHPDSLFFLGDMLEGGREWKTRQGHFVDPKWGSRGRTAKEQRWVKTWHRKYGDDFWLREYQRFGNIFFAPWNDAGSKPGPWQRGRKLVASLPGNHDIGFGAMVQLPVRDRFQAYFGEGNRVDVIGNHTIVSVDSVSLSAGTSAQRAEHDLSAIYGPVHEFLDGVQATKRKMAQSELGFWYGIERGIKHKHNVEDLDKADLTRWPRDPGPGAADFPTLLLTHVPLYREPATPCGPQREHWPQKKGSNEKDPANAISVVAGYQYQNVLSEEDSVRLVKSVGNVVHVFSGDDHDYCELVHSDSKENVREITVKTMSMTQGVPTPGFLMVSLWNPIDKDGKPLPGAPEQTVQTHLCLLPNQLSKYMNYIAFTIFSLIVLAIRAFFVPVLRLTPFALPPERGSASLPIYKDKIEPPITPSSGTSNGGGGSTRWAGKKGKHRHRWSTDGSRGPRITINEDYYDGGKAWKTTTGRGDRFSFKVMATEMWTTTWRVTWISVLIWIYLIRNG